MPTDLSLDSQLFKGKWNELKGEVQKEWGQLTNQELESVKGEATRLVGLIQSRYGYAKEKAEAELAEFLKKHT